MWRARSVSTRPSRARQACKASDGELFAGAGVEQMKRSREIGVTECLLDALSAFLIMLPPLEMGRKRP